MFRHRLQRLGTTVFVVGALLFSQLALASYVCPLEGEPASAAPAMEMAPGQPCEGMAGVPEQGQPVLCHQHCQNAPQSFDPMHPPVASLPAVLHVLAVPLNLDAAAVQSAVYAAVGEARPPPDPLFLSTLRLRV